MAAWYQYHNLTVNVPYIGLNKQWRLRSDCSYRQICWGRGGVGRVWWEGVWWEGVWWEGMGGIAFEVRDIDVKSKECFQ